MGIPDTAAGAALLGAPTSSGPVLGPSPTSMSPLGGSPPASPTNAAQPFTPTAPVSGAAPFGAQLIGKGGDQGAFALSDMGRKTPPAP